MNIALHFQSPDQNPHMTESHKIQRNHAAGPVMATPLVAVVSAGLAGFVGGYAAAAAR